MLELLSTSEKKTLRRWYKYAKAWGYRTTASGQPDYDHSLYEDEVKDLDEYGAITSCSDNVFRNVIQFKRDNVLRAYDVLGKASQADTILGQEKYLCKRSNLGKQLLLRYFEEAAQGFADEIENFNLDQEMSVPFEIIVNSALALYAIAYLKPKDLMDAVESIVEVKKEYEDSLSDDSDSDYD